MSEEIFNILEEGKGNAVLVLFVGHAEEAYSVFDYVVELFLWMKE